MEIRSVLRFAGMVLSPACACLMIAVGCTTESEIPLPPGAYVPPPEKQVPPENSALSIDPAPGYSSGENASFPVDSDIQEFTLEETESASPRPASARKTESKKAGPVFAQDDIIYTIRKNDTLGGIAHRHGMTAAALADYNGIALKSKIYPGKKLHIPAGMKSSAGAKNTTAGTKSSAGAKAAAVAIPAGATVYVVRAGDTLGGIAQKHSVRTADLVAANDLDVRKPIRAGQKLIIPASGKKTTAAPATKTAPAKSEPAAPVTKTTSAKAAKTPAPAKSTPAKKPAAKPAPAKTAEPAKTQEPAPAAAQSSSSADDLLKSIGSEPQGQTEPAPAPAKPAQPAPAASGSVSVTPPAKDDAFDADNSIMINIEREMTLEETAKAFDRSYETVKKLNPSIPADALLKAGTPVKIPIF